MKIESVTRILVAVGLLLIGGVILSGLGYVAKEVSDMKGRICRLEERIPQNLQERVSNIEINVAVIRELTTRVNNLSTRVAELNPAVGRIVSPTGGEIVHTIFNYEIELRNSDETRFYYITNRIGGSYWPKSRINLQNGVTRYTGTSNEGGNPPDGKFSVVLFEVNEAVHEDIVRWLNGTTFPGIQINGRELASVDVVLRR